MTAMCEQLKNVIKTTWNLTETDTIHRVSTEWKRSYQKEKQTYSTQILLICIANNISRQNLTYYIHTHTPV